MPDLVSTRRSLHAIAELLLAGPQYAAHGTIKLTVTPDGFATVRGPVVAVAGPVLRTEAAEVALDGHTVSEVAAEAGIGSCDLSAVYHDGCGLDETHLLVIDAAAAAELHEAFRRGDQALGELAPSAERVLWPEHFDVGISSDEVNYGVSAGDGHLPVPYAYIGPWSLAGLEGSFWNAPFGAARPVSEIEDLAGFFAEGAARLRR